MLSKVKIRNNATVGELNQQLAVLPGVTYVDLFDYLTDAQGQLNANYTTDGLHLSPQGYQVLAEPIHKGDFRMKVGLVLEGGGMRGLYTAGVLDAFFRSGIKVVWRLFRYRLEHFLVLITFLTSPKEPFATTNDSWETVAT